MREKNQETRADIIAEMRMGSPCGPCAYMIGLPDKEEVYESGAKRRITMIKNVTVQELADRLKAAAKREKAQHGNAAAMREVVTALAKVILPPERPGEEDSLAWVRAMQVKARAALAKPPRQCDVGTAEEKYQRWVHFCEQRLHSCYNCECKSPVGCSFTFGDMPYIKEGGGGK